MFESENRTGVEDLTSGEYGIEIYNLNGHSLINFLANRAGVPEPGQLLAAPTSYNL